MAHLVVVDGPNVAMRARFREDDPAALTDLVGRMLGRMIRWCEGTHLVVALDAPGERGGFRRSIHPGYKASREDRDGPRSSEVVAAVRPGLEERGILFAVEPEREADDVMATLARRAREAGSTVDLVTRDSDLLQAVTAGVRVVRPRRGGVFEAMDEAAVVAELGVRPDQIVDFKVLSGDTSDDIPRVGVVNEKGRREGITQKKAAKLLQRFDTLEGIYANVHLLPAKEGRWLLECKDQAFRMREVVRLRTDCRLDGLDAARTSVRRITA